MRPIASPKHYSIRVACVLNTLSVIYLEHGVEAVVLENGKLTMIGTDKRVLTGYQVGGQKLAVAFEAVTQETDASGRTLNKLVLTPESDDGKKFQFDIKPGPSMVHRIRDNGDFGRFLMSHGKQD